MSYSAKLDAIIASMKNDLVADLQKWISVRSLKAAPLPNAPFGAEVRRMLDMALERCREMGFAVEDLDGYAANVDLGEGDDLEALGILGHLDVVPEGDGWRYPPYGAVIEDGRMYGRGTSDDKGPVLAALYAMKAVKEAGIPLKRKVRMILGCDEETDWQDIEHYKQVAVMPRTGFSPDASYPVINIEKGICRLGLRAALNPADGLKIIAFNNGERPNVVPGKATATLPAVEGLATKATAAAEKLNIKAEISETGGVLTISVEGINGHAAYPEGALNANGEMLLLLKELGIKGSLATLAEKVGLEYKGQSLGIGVQDDMSSYLTCNMGIIRADSNGVYCTLDIRYPVMANPEMIIKNIKAALPEFAVEVSELKEPHYVPASSELVRSLLAAYNEETGLEPKCLSTGGGTYARALEEGVAFGASFPDDEDLAHQANEYISIDGLMKNVKIFASAIVKLAGKE